MKRLLLAVALGAAVACPSLTKGQDTPPPPPEGGPGPGDHMKGLSDADKAELKKAKDAAFAADPSLKTEADAMHAKMEANKAAGTTPTEADMAAGKAFHEKMNAAMIKADPAVEPILKKLKHHHGPGGPGGPDGGAPPPPPPSDT